MKKITLKTLLYLAVLTGIVALFALCISAAEYDYAHVKTFVDKSGYADITFANGWVQVATSSSGSKLDAGGDGLYVTEGDLPYGSGYRAYFNEDKKTLVLEGTSPTANSGDWQNSKGDRNHLFPYWCKLNASKVEYLEFRGVTSFNNTGYVIRPLVNVKTIKIDTRATLYRGTKDDTSLLGFLTSLTTVGWGSWDKTTGVFTHSAKYYHEGVVDLRGFKYLHPSGTTSVVPDQVLFANDLLRRCASVTEVILPGAPLALLDKEVSYSISVVSDGTDSFPKYDGSGNIAAGSVAYKMTNKETGAVAYGTNWQAPTGWSMVRMKAADIEPYLGDFSGMIPFEFAKGATALRTATVPEGVNLHRIYKDAFAECSSLRELRIEGTVDENFTIDAGAFGSGKSLVSGVTISVTSERDLRIVNAALEEAGYTDKTVVRAIHMIVNPITADGFQVKIGTGYNGLRGLFSFDEDSKAANAALGYSFVEYGVAVCTRTVAEAHASNDDILMSENPKVRKIAIERADGTGVNRYVDYQNRQFCIAIVGIPQDNSMDDIYFLAYSVWDDEEGHRHYVYKNYVASDKEKYVNLYEVTLGLLKNGLLNSETVKNAGGDTDAIIWNPLKIGAVTIAAGDFATPGTPQNASTGVTYKLNVDAPLNADGSFTYLDQKLYALTGATGGNYSFNPSGFEETPTTNVVWSLYTWGDEYVAVYRRDPDAAADAKATLPTQTINSRKGIHPFREGYGALNTNKVAGDITVHTPLLTTENAKKVATIVLDYGINSTESRPDWMYNGSFALANAPYTTTIVYPNGFAPRTSSQSLFRNDTALKNVIWANKPAVTNSQKYHMGDVSTAEGDVSLTSLADLRGMGGINAEAPFMDSGIENILFAGFGNGNFIQTFAGMTGLNRVWIAESGETTAPAEKTIDLSLDTKVKTLGRQCFSLKTEGYTIKLSEKVTTVSPYAGSYGDAFATTFGSKLLPIAVEAANPALEESFYDYYVSLVATKYRIYPQNITINGKSYKDIREEVCFAGESKLVVYQPLHSDINRNYDYKVTVHQGDNSAALPVYNHTMFNQPGDRSVGGDSYRRYSTFAFCGDQVRVDIKVGCDFESYSVIPSAKKFTSTFDAVTGTISVYLDKPDYFGIRLNDDDNSIISIFADRPEYPDEEGITSESGDAIYVGPGQWYFPQAGDGITETTNGHKGTLYITKPNTTVYVAPGGVLYGRVRFTTAAIGSSVIGHGAIVDPFADNRVLDIRQGGTEGGGDYTSQYKSQMMQVACANFSYDGPVLMDARCFNLVAYTKNVDVRNYKAMSSMMTTDGITDGTSGGRYEHCWIYCGDNALVVSGSNGAHYNDITIGTTCAAIFPQSSPRNTLLENIYVFRSNDGIINHRYNPNGQEFTATMTFRNFDCIDIINYPQFFYGHNMGLSTQKVFTFENVSLPWSSGVTNPHAKAIASTTALRNVLVEVTQPSTSIPTGNYTMNFINTYMDGVLLDSADKAVFKVDLPEGATMTYNFSSESNGYTPAERNINYVNYTAPGKVYIGTLLVGFENDVIIEGDTFYLPASEILTKLRTTAAPTVVTKNGIEYVAHTELKASGAASDAVVSGGSLTITPVAPSANANIVIDNSGLVTREFEVVCYHIDLVQCKGDGVMYAYPHGGGQFNGGIGYNITEEVKMYGAGEYKLTLKARCQILEGGGYTPVSLVYNYENKDKFDTNTRASYTLTDDWQECTLTFTITEDMIANGTGFATYIAAKNNVPVEYYAVKDMTVTKIS